MKASSNTNSSLRSRRPRYRVDLAAQQTINDLCYVLLLELLPDLDQTDNYYFQTGEGETSTDVQVAVVDRAPYTTTIQFIYDTDSDWAPERRLRVCLYHDASMAEVVAWDKDRYWQPRYTYPNERMYQENEKAQINQFLLDTVLHCHRQGERVAALV